MAVTDVFNFTLAADPDPVETYFPAQRKVNVARSGKKFTLVRADVLEFKAKFAVAVPQPVDTGLGITDVLAFIDTHKAEPFLFMCYRGPSLRREVKTIASGAGDTVFAFNHRYLDASSVEVYVDDVLQTSGYTFSGNNVAPIATFSLSPGVSTVRLEANFLVPVIFSKNPGDKVKGITDAKQGAITADSPQSWTFEIVETGPGDRFVNPTGMSGA